MVASTRRRYVERKIIMNNWTELLVSLAVAAVPIIGAWISKQLLANKQALTLVKVLGPLANAAVTAAEQLGVTQAIDGAVKKSTAIQAVKDGLKSLGFTSTDEQTIANAVEKAYADLKDSLAETYPQKTVDQEASNQDKVAAAAQAAADAVKAQLAPTSVAPQQ
jgi:LL-H family phage holin